METIQAPGIDSLASLEERITRAVQLITDLRSANAHLLKERDELTHQLEEARGERKEVRSRIEKLLSQLDLLSAS